MDHESQNAIRLLEALQDAMHDLGAVWSHFTLHGARPGRPDLVLSGRPDHIHAQGSEQEFRSSIVLGLGVSGSDAREYELGVYIYWDAERWTIQTMAWVESDERNQDLLRKLPERTASNLTHCIEAVRAAISDLTTFADLIPGKSAS